MRTEGVPSGLPEGWSVTTQRKGDRYAYVIHEPGFWPFVSPHRFHSPEAAQQAGDRDALATVAVAQPDMFGTVDQQVGLGRDRRRRWASGARFASSAARVWRG